MEVIRDSNRPVNYSRFGAARHGIHVRSHMRVSQDLPKGLMLVPLPSKGPPNGPEGSKRKTTASPKQCRLQRKRRPHNQRRADGRRYGGDAVARHRILWGYCQGANLSWMPSCAVCHVGGVLQAWP